MRFSAELIEEEMFWAAQQVAERIKAARNFFMHAYCRAGWVKAMEWGWNVSHVDLAG